MKLEVPMSSPDIGEAEVAAVNRALASGQLSIGPNLDGFEKSIASYVSAPHAIGVNSGTSGLHLAVIAAGVAAQDFVITTPFSFVASANCILYEKAIPIFVDVDPVTGNIDPNLVAAAAEDLTRGGPQAQRWLPPKLRGKREIESGRLKALLPVHVYGQPADMDPLLEVARQYELAVIEDSCEAIGAEYKGRRVGTIGDAGVFAFYANKQMTTGEGGALVTNRDDWDPLFRSMRNQGRDIFNAWLQHSRLGYNYRLDEMSAALGLAQVGRLDALLSRRAQVAEWYNQRLRNVGGIEIPRIVDSTTRMSWFVYVIRIAGAAMRGRVMSRLEQSGIPSRPYFTPITGQPFYVDRFGFRPEDFPITDKLGRVSLALPFSSVMTEEQVEIVCGRLSAALRS